MKRRSVFEQEKKTKTSSKSLEAPQHLVQDFLGSRKALIETDLNSASGLRICRKYTILMDRFIRSLFHAAGFTDKLKSTLDSDLAVVALGSYGRRELCLASDVDLMVIHQVKLSSEMLDVILRAIYPLWDAKLEVGHTILTVQECIRLALQDFPTLTSIMDARFLLGSRAFYRLFDEAFWSRIYREKQDYLKAFLNYNQERIEKLSTGSSFVEPDIKEGLGGLRDLHFMSWMARIYFKCKRLNQINRFAAFSFFEFDKLSHSTSALLKVRNHLHHLTGRKEDRLFLINQQALAHSLKYKDRPHVSAAENFLRDIYLHLNRIRYSQQEFLAKALDILDPLPLQPTPSQLSPEFQVVRGNIVLKEGRLSEKRLIVILQALAEANRLGLFLGSGFIWEAKRIIAARRKELLKLPEARDLFLELILKPKNPKITRLALEIGLITLFIPEFKKIRNFAELGFYHVRTVDLHSLKALDIMKKISDGVYDDRWPLFKEVFQRLAHPEWVYMAALLHDIGKGYGGNHSSRGARIIPDILARLGFGGEALGIIPLLVREHLLLTRVSQHRDLNDEKTSVRVAQTLQSKEVLDMLFLVTLADVFSTSPIASSDWKIMLLIELYAKVDRILVGGVLASPDATKRIEDNKKMIRKALGRKYPKADIMVLIDQIPSRYFLNSMEKDMVQHFRLALSMGSERLVWHLEKLVDAPVTRIVLCTYDKPGLFSKVAGVLTLNNIIILSANVFTLKNGLAFDLYEVTNPLDSYRESERWDKINKELKLALADQLPLDHLIKKKDRAMMGSGEPGPAQTRLVRIDNDISDFFSVIEVRSGAKVGLLYELASALFSLGLNIRFARFSRDGEKMSGDFYVRDSLGQKIYDAMRMDEIRNRLTSVAE